MIFWYSTIVYDCCFCSRKVELSFQSFINFFVQVVRLNIFQVRIVWWLQPFKELNLFGVEKQVSVNCWSRVICHLICHKVTRFFSFFCMVLMPAWLPVIWFFIKSYVSFHFMYGFNAISQLWYMYPSKQNLWFIHFIHTIKTVPLPVSHYKTTVTLRDHSYTTWVNITGLTPLPLTLYSPFLPTYLNHSTLISSGLLAGVTLAFLLLFWITVHHFKPFWRK